MKTLIILAWRNIWRNKRRSFISIASVLFAVLFAISATSFEKGSYGLMIKNMIKLSTGYIQIQDVLYEEEPSIDNSMLYDEALLNIISEFEGEIEYTVPRIQSFALAATSQKTRGTMIIGISPENENRFNNLSENIVKGEFIDDDDEAVILAQGVAEILNLDVGDTLVIIGQGFQGVNAAGMYPVKGIVKLSLQELNNNAVYMPLKAAQWFYAAEDRISSLIIMPENPKHTKKITGELNEKLDKEWYVALTWEDMMRDFLRMMELDTAGNKVISLILYIVIGFGLFGTILTMMLERIKEFKILISIGMKRLQLAVVCMLESLFLSFIGVIIGIAVTFPIMLYFNLYPIQLKGEMADMMLDYGFEAVMPTSISPDIFIFQAIIIFVLALLIGLYPVYKIIRLEIVNK